MKYLKTLFVLASAIGLNAFSPSILKHIVPGTEVFWVLSIFFGFGWVCYVIESSIFRAFTLQLIVSVFLHDALSPLAPQTTLIVAVCTVLAVIILKSGGDEVDRRHFPKIALPTILLATLGYILTFFLALGFALAIGIEARTAALLAAIVGSTDPAALIPTLKDVPFKPQYKRLVDISVAESAMNDAVGAIFTAAVIIMIKSGVDVASVGNVFAGVLEPHNMIHLGKEVAVGAVGGLIGWFLMRRYEKYKLAKHEMSHDFAAVLFVPIVTYTIAVQFGGNGYLAAFIAGMVANYNHSNHRFSRTLGVMETQIDSLVKPVIFMMAGALVSIGDLWDNAFTGFAISMLFIFFVRPVAVFGSLWLPLLIKRMTVKEALFLCVVRETGVIPIVLAVVAFKEFDELTTLLPLVAWVVIWTLTILPAITPWWAKLLGLTEEVPEAQVQTESPLRPGGNWLYVRLNDWRNFSFRLRGGIPRLMPKKK